MKLGYVVAGYVGLMITCFAILWIAIYVFIGAVFSGEAIEDLGSELRTITDGFKEGWNSDETEEEN